MTTKVRHACQNAIVWSVLVSEFLDGPSTALELKDATGMRHETIMGYIRALRRQRAVYVAAWVDDTAGRRTTAAYALGKQRDAKRIPKKPIDIKRAYRERKRMRELQAAMRTAA